MRDSLFLLATLALLCNRRSFAAAGRLVERMTGDPPNKDFKFDWRDKGIISPVKDLKEVGSSYAVALAEGIESYHAISTHKLINMSFSEVFDCCLDEKHQPKYDGFECVWYLSGLCSADDYKPTPGHKTCNSKSCKAATKTPRTDYIGTGDEQSMKTYLTMMGPMVAYVDGSRPSFQEYTSGIYKDANCSTTPTDLVVQVMGMGTEGGKDYWLIKNSWGTHWGDKGFMKIERGTNMCGIASNTFFADLYQ